MHSTDLIYTGVGSRSAVDKPHVMVFLRECGRILATKGWLLRSGGARGSDKAFEDGCNAGRGRKEIFVPRPDPRRWPQGIYVDDPRTRQMAALIHPAWDKCDASARDMHSRNIPQVLGRDLLTPSRFCLCWTEDGRDSGGTRTAIVLARRNNVPVLNLNEPGFKMTVSEVVAYMEESI